MYPIKLIHISDIHFSSGSLSLQPVDIKQPLIDLINEKIQNDDTAYLILSGDITFGANMSGYFQGSIFFNDIITQTNIQKENIITCPGNHDISNSAFKNFDIFTYQLRNDTKLKFNDASNVLLCYDNLCFLTINSSYHCNCNYGLVNVIHLKTLLSSQSADFEHVDNKVAVVHHHFLNFLENDTSIVRNSYQILDLLKYYGFTVIFHGHQHTKQEYNINGIKIKGISSPTEGRSSSNLIGYYEINADNNLITEEYLYSKDTIQVGMMGRYIKNG